MREIRQKLNLVGKESGLAEDGNSLLSQWPRAKWLNTHVLYATDLQELDIEGEWDPDKHDAQMAALYDNENDVPEEDVSFPFPDLS